MSVAKQVANLCVFLKVVITKCDTVEHNFEILTFTRRKCKKMGEGGGNNNDNKGPVDRGGWKSGFPTIQSLSFRDGRKDTHNASVVGTMICVD